MSRVGNSSEIPELFYAFGLQLNTFMPTGIFLKYFLYKVLRFD